MNNELVQSGQVYYQPELAGLPLQNKEGMGHKDPAHCRRDHPILQKVDSSWSDFWLNFHSSVGQRAQPSEA